MFIHKHDIYDFIYIYIYIINIKICIYIYIILLTLNKSGVLGKHIYIYMLYI